MNEGHARDAVATLLASLPLPVGWKAPEVFVEQIELGGIETGLLGLTATEPRTGRETTGSAAEWGRFPVERATFELIERVWILEAMAEPQLHLEVRREGTEQAQADRGVTVLAGALFPAPRADYCLSRSNGVAAHRELADARQRARWELIERDRVLKSWYGGAAPAPREVPGQLRAWLGTEIEWQVSELSDRQHCRDPGASVAAVIALPRRAAVPLACGFAARDSWQEALDAAVRECVQVLSFLWGEELPSCAPVPSCDSSYHQAYYLVPENQGRLRTWLAGGHESEPLEESATSSLAEPALAALSSNPVDPAWVSLVHPAQDRLHVVKILDERLWPLAFGPQHPRVDREISQRLGPHPIP